jgi:hypothetical protein
MAFNDGEPLDASKLGKLEQDISILNSTLPTIGSSTTNVTVNNQTIQQAVVPQIQGGSAGTRILVAGKNEWPITFTTPMNGTPKAVMIQTRVNSSQAGKWHPQIDIKTGTITSTGCTLMCTMPSGSGAPMGVYISYIAICHA